MLGLLLIAMFSPQLRVVLDTPAAQAVYASGVTVVLEPDLLHLAGFDASGKRLWRRQHQKKARGIQALFEHDGRVLMYAGEQISVIAPGTGRAGEPITAPYLSSPGNPGCWLNGKGGAYAFSCPCRFQFALDDGRPVGEPYRFHRICRRDFDGRGNSCGCWGSSGDLIGRSGDLLLARVEEPPTPVERGKKRRLYGDLLVAMSVKTGKEVWRQASPFGQAATYINGLGIMPSGKTFWTADAFGRISGHDVATGRLLWRDSPPPVADGEGRGPHQPESWVAAAPDNGVFFFANGQATLYDARIGTVRWRVSADGVALAMPAAALPTERALEMRSKGALRLLRMTDGGTRATLQIGHERARVQRVGDRVVVVDGTELRLYSLTGEQVATATAPRNANLTVGLEVVVVDGTEMVRVFDRMDLAEVGRIAGRHRVVGIGDGVVVLDGADERVRVLRVPTQKR